MIAVGCDPATYDPATDFADGSFSHSGTAVALVSEISSRLKGCEYLTFGIGLRLGTASTGDAFYPESSVVYFGRPTLDVRDATGLTFANPTVLIEVVSPETDVLDTKFKPAVYRTIGSLKAYVLVYENRPATRNVCP